MRIDRKNRTLCLALATSAALLFGGCEAVNEPTDPAGYTATLPPAATQPATTAQAQTLPPETLRPAETPALTGSATPPAPASDAAPESTAPTRLPNSGAPPLQGAQLHPVVVDDYLLGAWGDNRWLSPADVAPSLHGGEGYTVLREGASPAKGTGSAVAPDSGSGEPYAEFVRMTARGGAPIAPPYVAFSADRDAQPRAAQALKPDNDIYKEIVAGYLKERKLTGVRPEITQLYRVDLEGDGVDEVVIHAQNIAPRDRLLRSLHEDSNFFDIYEQSASARDGYAFIVLRKIVDGKVQSLFLADHTPRLGEGSTEIPNLYAVRGFLDLNGDGRLEIVLSSRYYEGSDAAVFDVNGGEVTAVLANGWGV